LNSYKPFFWNLDSTKAIPGFVMILMLALSPARGQVCEIGLNYYAGLSHTLAFEPGGNGVSLDALYVQSISEELQALGGVEMGTTGWGSQLLFPLAARWGNNHQVELEILNGMALYRQGPRYVAGAGASYVYTLFRQKKHRLVLSAGLRVTVQPAYREYSNIYSYLDLPLRIRWQFGRLSPGWRSTR
jgi:hypothetical protein